MSAWYCNDDHLAYLLAAAFGLNRRDSRTPFMWKTPEGGERELTSTTFQETGQMLRDRNLLNLWYLYGEEARECLPEDTAFRPVWFREVPSQSIMPVEVISAAHCYRYQCSDGDNWRGSEAEDFINELIDTACHNLEGYASAPWGPPEHLIGRLAITVPHEDRGEAA